MENFANALDAATLNERSAIGAALQNPPLLRLVDFDLPAKLLHKQHRDVLRAMTKQFEDAPEDPFDEVLLATEAGVDVSVIADLKYSGAVATKSRFNAHVRQVCEADNDRQVAHLIEELPGATRERQLAIIHRIEELRTNTAAGSIRRFEEVPEIQCIDLPPLEYIVPALGIARNTLTLWSGTDGDGKTALAGAMAVAVALGREFLGLPCQQCPTLYLDHENPGGAIQARIRAMVGEESVAALRIWGKWNSQQPPECGNPLLLAICKETRPLLIIDPFRYFHSAEENDSGEMAAVMKYLRNCAAVGASVVLLHHPARSEGSTGRGSTAIRAACDLAFIHSLDKETGLITLKVDKNRNGERRNFTIRPDFEQCTFELTESAWVQHRSDELTRLRELIAKNPGASTSQLAEEFGGRKTRLLKLLEEGLGTHWARESGSRGAKVYSPLDGTRSLFLPKGREQGNRSGDAPAVPGTSGNRWEHGTGGGDLNAQRL
jgi:hypothetical protein